MSLEAIADTTSKRILKASKVIMKFIPKINYHPYEHLNQISAKLKLPRDVVTEMELVCKEIENWDVFEHQMPRPRTIAAAVIYLYSKLKKDKVNKTLAEIKDAAMIGSDNTIKKYFCFLDEKKDQLMQRAIQREEELKKKASNQNTYR